VKLREELLGSAERDAIVAPQLHEHLEPLGLTQAGARTWIDGSHPPIRRMFELLLLKGASMRARCGFSLDFVPHISGGRVGWHRSDKTAILDVIVDPTEKTLPRLGYIHGVARLHDDLQRLLPIAAQKATETWRRGETESGLLALVREIREHNTNCFPFDMYTQLPLAYAFLSAKLGDLSSAEQDLDCYVSRHKLDDEAAATLKKLAQGVG